jgi:hypothetical protein
MPRLEHLTRGASVKGFLPDGLVIVGDMRWDICTVVQLTYQDPSGPLGSELLCRDREPTIEVDSAGAPWSFGGEGGIAPPRFRSLLNPF